MVMGVQAMAVRSAELGERMKRNQHNNTIPHQHLDHTISSTTHYI
jgi:hypothetical protein